MSGAGDPGQAVGAFAGAVLTGARDVVTMVVDPASRLHGPALLASLLVALWLTGGRVRLRRWLRTAWHPSARLDLALLLTNRVLRSVGALVWSTSALAVGVSVAVAADAAFGVPTPPAGSRLARAVVYTLVLFVAWDLSRYLLHLALHRIPALWELHKVHHSAEVLTPLSLYRLHPLESLLYAGRGVLVTGVASGLYYHWFRSGSVQVEILGVNALVYGLNVVGGNLRHSALWWSWGPLERWLISPAQHQVHHQAAPPAGVWGGSANLGTWLALWDRLGGTWVPARRARPGPFGLPASEANHDPHRLGSALLAPLLALARARLGGLIPGRRRLGPAVLGGLLLLPSPARGAPAGSPAAPITPTDRAYRGPDAAPTAEGRASLRRRRAPARSAAEAEEASADLDEPPGGAEAGAAAPVLAGGDVGREGAGLAGGPPHPPPPSVSPSDRPASAVPESPAEAGEAVGGHRRIEVGSMFEEDPRARVAGSAQVITEQELERHEYDDVHRIMAQVPGVYVRGEEGFGLRPNIGLRGANPDRSAKVTLMEDGILLAPAPYAAPAAYFFPLPTRMVGIEVAKGPASIRYGPNTIGGAINMRTREIPSDPAAMVDLAAGRFGYFKATGYAGTTYKGFGVLAEAGRVSSTGFKQLDGGGDTGFSRNDTMLELGYRTDEGRRIRHAIELKGGYANEDARETYLGLSDADFAATPYRRYAASARDELVAWRTQASATYVLTTREGLRFSARLYRHDYRRAWDKLASFAGGPSLSQVLANPDAGQNAVFAAILRGEEDSNTPDEDLVLVRNDRRYVSQGVQSTVRWERAWKKVRQELEFGARLHQDSVRRDHTGRSYRMVSGVLVPEDAPRTQVTLNEGRALAGAFHLYDVLTLWDRLTLAPGLRLEVISMSFRDDLAGTKTTRLDMVPIPGLGTHVQIVPWLGAFAGVHRGFSPASPGQPKSVRPETSVNYEAGLRAAWGGLRAEAVGFFSDYRNLNGICTLSAGCTDAQAGEQFSAGQVYVGGLETLARYQHRFDSGFGLMGSAQYTFTRTRFRQDFSSAFPQWGNVSAGDELPYVPRHLLSVTAGAGGQLWDLTATVNYNGVMRDVAGQGPIPDGERIEGFVTLDLAGEIRLLGRMRLYARVDNATGQAYMASRRPFGARPGAPLTFALGVKIYAR